MIDKRKKARQRLKLATRSEYEALTYAAKLTPIQKQILDMYILQDVPICEIAFSMNCCESGIRRRLSEVYDKVSKL